MGEHCGAPHPRGWGQSLLPAPHLGEVVAAPGGSRKGAGGLVDMAVGKEKGKWLGNFCTFGPVGEEVRKGALVTFLQ